MLIMNVLFRSGEHGTTLQTASLQRQQLLRIYESVDAARYSKHMHTYTLTLIMLNLVANVF